MISMIKFELKKIYLSKSWRVLCSLVLLFQPLLALMSAQQIANLGLTATPETHPELIQAIPPVDYLGFDAVLFGLLPMIVFGGIYGASEFSHHQLRTTLLCQNNREKVFFSKLLALLIATLWLGALAIYGTIEITHLGLQEQGLNVLTLSSIAWKFIGYALIQWLFLTTLSFLIGHLFKNAIVPLAFLIPQVYNLGNYLAEKWPWGKYLPVAASNQLVATPTDSFSHQPIEGLVVLSLWVIVTVVLASYVFSKSDLGGSY